MFLKSPGTDCLPAKETPMKLPAANCGVSKRNCAEAKPAFTRRKRLRCARSTELWRGSPRLSSLQQAAGYFGEGE
jgi:hypothetical protein